MEFRGVNMEFRGVNMEFIKTNFKKILTVIVLLIGLTVGLYLIGQKTIFRSKANLDQFLDVTSSDGAIQYDSKRSTFILKSEDQNYPKKVNFSIKNKDKTIFEGF